MTAKEIINSDDPSAPWQDTAPKWDELRQLLSSVQTDAEKRFRKDLAEGRGSANSLATLRLFDAPDGTEPRVILYRDYAAWCPYCQKVWMMLEEKRIPYKVEKVNMRCYGDKPDWFMRISPSGGIPVAKIDGRVISESNDIMQALEDEFPEYKRMLPAAGDAHAGRVDGLLRLERQLFSAWFRWLVSPSREDDAQQRGFESLLSQVDDRLREGHELTVGRGGAAGRFFLGAAPSLVDCMYAPFLERMAASIPYYKGLVIRNNPRWPHVNAWFDAMEGLESYKGIQSDYYTHCHDLPPQIGNCFSHAAAAKYADEIDGRGGAWTLPLKAGGGLEPSNRGEAAARREAAERVTHNAAGIVPFMLRAVGRPGRRVGAELSDPHAQPDLRFTPHADAALRLVIHSLLAGLPAAAAADAPGAPPPPLPPLPPPPPGLPAATARAGLEYLRDRVSVPRDMSFPAARQLRAHINRVIAHLTA